MANRRQRTGFGTGRGQKGKFSQWLKKNKGTPKFEAIVRDGMIFYIERLIKAMEKQFEDSQPRPKGKSTIRWRKWAINKGQYVRGKTWGGRMNNIDSDASPAKGLYLSGKLKKTISSCRIEVIGGDVRIITPKYIDDFRALDPTTNNITVSISERLKELGYSDYYRKVPAEFLGPKGAQFRLAKSRVMALLRRAAGVI